MTFGQVYCQFSPMVKIQNCPTHTFGMGRYSVRNTNPTVKCERFTVHNLY